jgi:hypothetical protein
MAWSSKDSSTVPKGATAFGIQLLDRFVARIAKGADRQPSASTVAKKTCEEIAIEPPSAANLLSSGEGRDPCFRRSMPSKQLQLPYPRTKG